MNTELFHFIFDISKIAGGILLAQSVLTKYESIDETIEKLAKWLIGFKSTIGGVSLGMGAIYAFLYSGCFVMDLSGILVGLLLLGVSLKELPAVGNSLTKASTSLKAFSIPIGIAAIVSGIFGLFNFACF